MADSQADTALAAFAVAPPMAWALLRGLAAVGVAAADPCRLWLRINYALQSNKIALRNQAVFFYARECQRLPSSRPGAPCRLRVCGSGTGATFRRVTKSKALPGGGPLAAYVDGDMPTGRTMPGSFIAVTGVVLVLLGN